MLAAIISQYLKSNRRLVIPQLGAFLVKEPDRQIVFSALLTRDDGILRMLLTDSGMSEVEANGMIDRVIFDIRFAIENNGIFHLEGVGSFSSGKEGKICFESYVQLEVQEPYVEELDIADQQQAMVVEQVVEESSEPQLVEEVNIPQESTLYRFEADPDLEGLSYNGSKRRRGGSKKIDWWLIIGIAALVLAVAAIIYGFLRDGAGSSSDMFLSELLQSTK